MRDRPLVLLVDDAEDSRLLYEAILQDAGCQVESALDGVEAVEKAHTARPDLVVMDVGLPRMNGLEAARRIREQNTTSATPILLLSGYAVDAKGATFCDRVLRKPCDPDVFADAVAKLLKNPNASPS